MDPNSLTNNLQETNQELLEAQSHIWNHIFYFLNSMALKCAIELGIPDAIHNHGKPMTLLNLAMALEIPPTKTEDLNRLMRSLVNSNFFSKKKSPDSEDEFVFDLTINSKLLLRKNPLSQAPLALFILNQIMVDPSHHLSTWLRINDDSVNSSPFHIAHGKSFWEQTMSMANFNECFNLAMACDAPLLGRFMSSNLGILLFKGVESLVDVGGGNGAMARAICESNPEMKCIVLDLPHVIDGLGESGLTNLVYVGGNMFEAIPQAQAVLLKWILHDWSDEDCIKILEQCKKAIPSKEKGGKVIIIETVVNSPNHPRYCDTQILFDMEMMSVTDGGKERTEQQWKTLFTNAGFSDDYNMLHELGPRSILQIYPS